MKIRSLVATLAILAVLLFPQGASAHQAIGDYSYFCYFREVYHNQQPNGKYYSRSVRIWYSTMGGSNYVIGYREQSLNVYWWGEYWSDVHDYSCRSSRGVQP
jgi:hypothetical protein